LPNAGVAGTTLGGGIGWLLRKYGLGIDNLVSADVVTADGRALTASADEHPQLFWALRGGGGNFGVVTSLEFALHSIGPVYAGMVAYPLPAAPQVLRVYRDLAAGSPDEVTMVAAMITGPTGAKMIAIAACYDGPTAEAERVLRPLRAAVQPVMDDLRPRMYDDLVGMLAASAPSGMHRRWRSNFLDGLSDGLIETVAAAFEAAPSPLAAILIEQFGGPGGSRPRRLPSRTATRHSI
jgi:FAD/FMN-containing dehydrogenase